jgi:hypothetical protein
MINLTPIRTKLMRSLTPLWNVLGARVGVLFEVAQTYVMFILSSLGVRLRKGPYADSYWFLYSAKLTYYTERSIG